MKTTRQPSKKTNPSARPLLYQLKVTLLDSKPPIWRRLLVRGDTTLARLHAILQTAMGWEDYHVHTFKVRGTTYAVPDPDWDPPVSDEAKPTLTGLGLAPGSRFEYKYDMGDGWMHDIEVEAVEEAETKNPRRAVCLDGKRACPPEDVGGTCRYEYFLKVIRNPKHREHKEMLRWVGGEFDSEAFSVAETDEELKGL
jgi:hypothetical protein